MENPKSSIRRGILYHRTTVRVRDEMRHQITERPMLKMLLKTKKFSVKEKLTKKAERNHMEKQCYCLDKTCNIQRHNRCLHRFGDGRGTVPICTTTRQKKPKHPELPQTSDDSDFPVTREKAAVMDDKLISIWRNSGSQENLLFCFRNSVEKYRVTGNLCPRRHIWSFFISNI